MVTLFRSARCLAPASPFPKGQGGDPRALALLTLPGEKSYPGPRSLVGLCRVPHDTAWVLCGVSTAALQAQAVPRTQPAYTQSMSELLSSQHGRSAWEPSTPAWALDTFFKPPLLRLTRVSSKLSQLSRVSPSRTLAHLLVRQPRSGLCSQGPLKTQLESCPRSGPLRGHSTLSRPNCQRASTCSWASG